MIRKLSTAQGQSHEQATALVMVGSFAPAHPGHFDAMESAEQELTKRGEYIAGSVFAPNSDSYVSIKLADSNKKWNFERRANQFVGKESGLFSPSYVDDITGRMPPERSISEEVIQTVAINLGIKACNAVLVVGSDQILSMRDHLEQNRAICVMRPGYAIDNLLAYEQEAWLRDAIYDNRYMITSHQDMVTEHSSTLYRQGTQPAKV